jgi:murein DD-endopeptidase MepM/ murein hydrolase activator NlpD
MNLHPVRRWILGLILVLLSLSITVPVLGQDPILSPDGELTWPDELALIRERQSYRARTTILTYIVQDGDTLWSIAERFDLDVETLRWSNPEVARNPDRLRLGQELRILPVRGAYHVVAAGQTLEDVAVIYGVDPEAIIAYPLNDLRPPYRLQVGQGLVVPGGAKTVRLAKPRHVSAQGFAWPFSGTLTQRFHASHPAIDIGGPYGARVYACAAGTVVDWGRETGYGFRIVIDHGNGIRTSYGHLKGTWVHVGDRVSRGQLIGEVGSTGRSTGPHVHLEVWVSGTRVNPLRYLPASP